MRRVPRLAAAAVGVAVALPTAALVPGSSAGAEQVASVSTAAPSAALDASTRLAFTDERDALREVAFNSDYQLVDPCPEEPSDPEDPCEPEGPQVATTEHEGEASVGLGMAFVSTLESADGDVYLNRNPLTRVTCDTDLDTSVETHPVGNSVFLDFSDSSSGQYFADAVAYAARDSDDDDWDIYISVSAPIFDGGIARAAPGWGRKAGADLPAGSGSLAAAPTACDPTWLTFPITDTDGVDELWPTWLGDEQLAFSSTADGELADLGAISLDWDVIEDDDGPEVTDLEPGTPFALTTTPEFAETQPAAMVINDPDGGIFWLAFTTTEFRLDRSIAIMPLDPGAPAVDPFDTVAPQGSEAAWSTPGDPTSLAFTSTQEDPYGDIWVAELNLEQLGGPDLVDSSANLTGPAEGAGIGESHPAWTDGTVSEASPDRRIVFTSRRVGNFIENTSRSDRVLDGDISDVLATTGADRRVIRADTQLAAPFPFDEAGPSYSPDGTQIVYSRAGSPFGNRTLMVAPSDDPGAAAELLLPPGEQDPDASDSDPVWSPDGTRVAFVRTTEAGAAVWVFDLGTEEAEQISEDGVVDRHPSWSPNGRHIIVGRSVVDSEDSFPRDGARRQTAPTSESALLRVLDTEDPGGPGIGFDYCSDGCEVPGRSPAWSPDGTQVVYVDHGELTMITLEGQPPPPDDIWEIETPVTLIGFVSDDEGNVVPTAGRLVVETAEDPAWADDGSEIAFAGQQIGQPDNRAIYRITREGNVWDETSVVAELPITDDRGPDTEPTYSFDREADVRVTASVAGSPAVVGMSSVTATFTVTNLGPDPAFEVGLTASYAAGAVTSAVGPVPAGCAANGLQCTFPVLAPGATRIYRVQVTHAAAVMGNAAAVVDSTTPDPVLTNNQDSAPYEFVSRDADMGDLRVRVRVDEPVGYVGGLRTATFVVRNLGPDPVEDVALMVDWPSGFFPQPDLALPFCLIVHVPCNLGTLNPGDRVRYDVVVRLHSAGERLPIVGRVTTTTPDPNLANNRDRALLDVLQPELRILPSVARPGQVVLAYGEQMPPGTEIVVDWAIETPLGDPLGDPITVDPGPYLIQDDGTVRIPLLVLRKDLLGERVLTATSTTAEFLPLEAPLLVVLRQLGPPLFVERG